MSSDDKNDNSSDGSEPAAEDKMQKDPWTSAEQQPPPRAGSRRSTWERLTGKEEIAEGEDWERSTLQRLAYAALEEQKKNRRWGTVIKLLFLGYLFMVFLVMQSGMEPGEGPRKGKHTAVVDLSGVIAADSAANADLIIDGLRDAFKDKDTVGVILRINSPGGSPVQSGYINDEIVRLREKYEDVPLYAVIEDVCASGGYYVAAAADEIYADKASIVGSIGVLMDGFGFTDAMKKLGVERRLMTAGENKGFMDPFSEMRQEDVMHVKELLGNIHRQFIDTVKEGRGARLKENPQLFSGLIWTGEQSVELGLVDGLGSADFVAREIIGEKRMVNFTPQPDFFERFADRLGMAMGDTLVKMFGDKVPQLK